MGRLTEQDLIEMHIFESQIGLNSNSEIKFGEIIPLEEFKVPLFPKDCFPKWLEDYINAVSESTQTPTDLSAVIGLSALATTLAKKVKVQGKMDWFEPLNLYTAVVLPPGERKSAVFTHMTKPLEEYETKINEELRPKIIENRVKKELLEGALRNLKSIAFNSKKSTISIEEQVKEKALELEEFEDLKSYRLLADDVSPEKVAGLLADNNGRISILSAEGGIFQIMAGRYSQNGSCNVDVFLKGYDGDSIRVDRVGRTSEYIPEPIVTIGLTVQPDVLKAVMENSVFRGRGLTARFLFSVPKSKVGNRNIASDSIPLDIKKSYFENIKLLLKIEQQEQAPILRLSEKARIKSFEFAKMLEPRLIEDLELIEDWAAKLHGKILRIAGLLHCCEIISSELGGIFEPWKFEISEETFNKAVKIGLYFIEHSKLAFGLMSANQEIKDAEFILKFIKKKGLTMFTKRDIQKGNRTKFKNIEQIKTALELLLENNFIGEIPTEYCGKGRKPENRYILNPSFINKN